MKTERFASIDALRGFALLSIFVNHVPGTVFERYTHKNFGLSDAAEVFVLLAGIACAFAYGRDFQAMPMRRSFALVLRALQIYSAHLVILLVAGAIVAYATLSTQDPRLLEAMNFDLIVTAPVESLIGIVTLGFQPSYLNVLPLYVVVLLMAPAMLALLAIGRIPALVGSALLYAAAQLGLGLPSYPGSDDVWFFNPFAWQFLLMIGLVIGDALMKGERFTIRPWLVALCGAVVVGAAVAKLGPWQVPDWPHLPRVLWDNDKHLLSLPRLIHVLALAVIVAALPLERWVRRFAGAQPLVWMGRHSLAVFSTGTVLAILAQVTRIVEEANPRLDAALIAAGLAVQIGLAWTLEWNRRGRSETAAQAAGASPASQPASSPSS